MQAIGQLTQTQSDATQMGGDFFATLQGAVGHRYATRAFGGKVGGAQLDHLARAYKQHVGLAQVFEQLRGQAHGGGGHADRMRANFGGAANLFGHCKRALEELVERGTQSARVGCCAHGVLHLTQNLGLAEHHGVEPTGYSERMPCGIVFLQGVGVGLQSVWSNTTRVGQPIQGLLDLLLAASAVNFCAVTGRQNGDLAVLRHSLAQSI